MKLLTLYDRSRTTTDWSCPRKRWWQYQYAGRGIVSGHSSLELYLGTILHDGLAAIAAIHQEEEGYIRAVTTVGDYVLHVNTTKPLLDPPKEAKMEKVFLTAASDIRSSLLSATSGEVSEVDFAHEQAALVEGLLRGFYKHAWPRLMSAYPTIVHIEEEMRFDHDGLTFMSRPDLVVADKDGNLVYVEYKSTSSKKEGWVNSWATAVQLHSTVRAIEATTGEKVQTIIVQGLYKGYESYGKQNSPFCYAYKRPGNPPFTEESIRYDYAPGYKRSPTWGMTGGVASWVADMPSDLLGDQFPQVPPVFINEELVNSFFQQRAYREHEIMLAAQMMENADEDTKAGIMDAAFPQKFDQCIPYFGRDCAYKRICHGHVTDPLADGFSEREPHHQLEAEQFANLASVCTSGPEASEPVGD